MATVRPNRMADKGRYPPGDLGHLALESVHPVLDEVLHGRR